MFLGQNESNQMEICFFYTPGDSRTEGSCRNLVSDCVYVRKKQKVGVQVEFKAEDQGTALEFKQELQGSAGGRGEGV